MKESGARVIFENSGGKIYFPDGVIIGVKENVERNWLEIRTNQRENYGLHQTEELFECLPEKMQIREPSRKVSKEHLWHERLGHPGRDKARAIIKRFSESSEVKLDPEDSLDCHECIAAKSTQARMGKGSGERDSEVLGLIHVDLITDLSGTSEYRNILVAVDDHSGYILATPIFKKSDALGCLQNWTKFMENQTGNKVKRIRSDNGGEWASTLADQWSANEGILWEKTSPYTSTQNGRVERMNRTLMERVRALLSQRELPANLWPFAVQAAAFTINLTPDQHGLTPYEKAFKRKPDRFVQLLRVFGCLAWVFIPKGRREHGKIDARAVAAVLLGYSLTRKSWLFYSPNYKPDLFWSNSAKFLEQQSWQDRTEFLPLKIYPPKAPVDNAEIPDLGYEDQDANYEDYEDALKHLVDDDFPENQGEIQEEIPSEELQREEIPNSSTGAKIDESENKARKSSNDRRKYALIGNPKVETLDLMPTVKEAMAREDAQKWREAIMKEVEGLEKKGTWEIVDRPLNVRLVDSKLVLKIKTDANMKPTKYKARLVARGFTQQQGIDYDEIFAPVAPMEAIRAVLAIAAFNDWEIDCIDVVQAYLNSELHHEVYLKPPQITQVPEGKVYKLKKGLYGLKQSGREWNKILDQHSKDIGFKGLPCAPCIYLKGQGDKMVIITTYVDDMLIISPDKREVNKVKDDIRRKWEIEDNGPVTEFLGIKITRDRYKKILDLDLAAYIKKMISKWLPNGEKSWRPMICPLDAEETEEIIGEKSKNYQELVGQLLWVSNTVRPDISFAGGSLARYMSKPREGAWEAAIQVLKYLNQTAENTLRYENKEENKHPITTYTDANWASERATNRRSTSGSTTFIFGNLVSWKSQVQKCVSLSAVEAEFVAASDAAREALFFKYLLRDLGVSEEKPLMLTDSMGCVQVSKDAAKHWKLKHIDTRYHFIRDNVQSGSLEIKHIRTEENLADMLTKPVPKAIIMRTCNGINMVRPARGGVEDIAPTELDGQMN
ncbi:related to retrotransposon protein [Melanopsichium pennsylvanicum]|uniref:Related to retrotransposon protein n=1 Tax=Melanopsichium pennsylvanicum TaxID=63383 RepID=A0AAJ4XHB5_9BASI|nr:related to retrotransposon protein [Melanopsichium pennsylvanicum]